MCVHSSVVCVRSSVVCVRSSTVLYTLKFTLACECIASRVRAEHECCIRVQLSSARVFDMSTIVSVTRILIYGIATDDYVNFIVNYGPAVLL